MLLNCKDTVDIHSDQVNPLSSTGVPRESSVDKQRKMRDALEVLNLTENNCMPI